MSKLREILNILDEKTKAEIIGELLILSDNNWERVVDIVDPGYMQRIEKAEEKKVKKIIIDGAFTKFPDYSNRINSDFYIGEEKVKKEVYDDLEEKGIIPDLTKYKPVEKNSDSKALTPQFALGTAFRLKEGTFVIISGLLNSLVDRGSLHDYYWCVCVESGRCRVGQIRPFTNYMIEKYAKIL